jgi:hypothetical protein
MSDLVSHTHHTSHIYLSQCRTACNMGVLEYMLNMALLKRILKTPSSDGRTNCIVLWLVWPPRSIKCNNYNNNNTNKLTSKHTGIRLPGASVNCWDATSDDNCNYVECISVYSGYTLLCRMQQACNMLIKGQPANMPESISECSVGYVQHVVSCAKVAQQPVKKNRVPSRSL